MSRIKEEMIRKVAIAFMTDQPEEYEDATVEDVIEELKQTSDDFIENAYIMFCAEVQ